jgi:N-acylneuraminate cytidylyltransferase
MKNLQKIGGRTLVDLAVSQAVASGVFAKVFIDSDSEEIIHEGTNSGAVSIGIRDAKSSQGASSTEDSLISFLARAEESFPSTCEIWVLQPTAPLRNARTIQNFLQALPEQFESAASVSKPWQNPRDLILLDYESRGLEYIYDPQDSYSKTVKFVDGSIYVINLEAFAQRKRIFELGRTLLIEIDPLEGWDVDEDFQLDIARCLAATGDGWTVH